MIIMKIWMDDIREAPEGYIRTYNVPQAINAIRQIERKVDFIWEDKVFHKIDDSFAAKRLQYYIIEEIACDNDLGRKEFDGYKLLDWLEATGRNYPIRILTSNPVARQRMRKIIERNNWEERK